MRSIRMCDLLGNPRVAPFFHFFFLQFRLSWVEIWSRGASSCQGETPFDRSVRAKLNFGLKAFAIGLPNAFTLVQG